MVHLQDAQAHGCKECVLAFYVYCNAHSATLNKTRNSCKLNIAHSNVLSLASPEPNPSYAYAIQGEYCEQFANDLCYGFTPFRNIFWLLQSMFYVKTGLQKL